MLFYVLSALGLVPTFQTTKCQKLLNITMERTKLLEKRRQARVRQLLRDVIELLQRKKEHKIDPLLLRIWKEFCLFFVYAKTAEYCGFVQINLKDIAGQRECPSGLEEPLAGLCFAASCCADLPELQELREIFAEKYGKQIVSSGQDLTPNCHVNKQYLDCLYANNPSEVQKQALLQVIITKYNAQQQVLELCDSVSTKGFVVSKELVKELVNWKRTLEDRATYCSTFKRAYKRRKFGLNKDTKREKNMAKALNSGTQVCSDTGESLVSEYHDGYIVLQGEGASALMNKDLKPKDLHILHYIEQPSYSRPPQRPPPPPPPKRAPPPPPKRAPPPPPSTFRVISMPNFHNEKQVNANSSLPRCCSTMANDFSLETYGSHVHPRLPKYEDLVANFTALKHSHPSLAHHHIAGVAGQVF